MIYDNKGMIIVDMPENCKNCRFYYFARDGHKGKLCGGCRIIPTVAIQDSSIKQDWCPIKPMPTKFESAIEGNWDLGDGWNHCIDEIIRRSGK